MEFKRKKYSGAKGFINKNTYTKEYNVHRQNTMKRIGIANIRKPI